MVSIRSPHGCKGRFAIDIVVYGGDAGFQSAPLTDVRGDSSAVDIRALAVSFNPLPSRM